MMHFSIELNTLQFIKVILHNKPLQIMLPKTTRLYKILMVKLNGYIFLCIFLMGVQSH